MNCVHNELCVVTRACVRSEVLGLMCTTLYLAPRAEFTLPDVALCPIRGGLTQAGEMAGDDKGAAS